jgi:hypothetical protein
MSFKKIRLIGMLIDRLDCILVSILRLANAPVCEEAQMIAAWRPSEFDDKAGHKENNSA